MSKNKTKLICIAILIALVVFNASQPAIAQYENRSIEQLNREIEQMKKDIDELHDKSAEYEKAVKEKRREASTLKNQIYIINNHIAKTEVDIESTQKEIDKNGLEVAEVKLQIKEKEVDITRRQEMLAVFLRLLYQKGQRSYLEILLTRNSLSDFFEEIKYLEKIQNQVSLALAQVKQARARLELKKNTLEAKERDLEELGEDLEIGKFRLEDQIVSKDVLLTKTRNSEREYQRLLEQIKAEKEAIDAEVIEAEQVVREKLLRQQETGRLGKAEFIWPVPLKKITAYFHDPTYPYRHLFEHPGIDLRAGQGTPIKASSSGYVAFTKTGQYYGNYVSVIHADGLTSLYAHLSKFNVKPDTFVVQGDIIGWSGGTRGTQGAGLSTGPHLHFEIRSRGIPVDPLKHLP